MNELHEAKFSRGVGALDQVVRLINIHVRVFCGILPVRKASLYKRQVFRRCIQLSMLGCSRANMEKKQHLLLNHSVASSTC